MLDSSGVFGICWSWATPTVSVPIPLIGPVGVSHHRAFQYARELFSVRPPSPENTTSARPSLYEGHHQKPQSHIPLLSFHATVITPSGHHIQGGSFQFLFSVLSLVLIGLS